ncbi:DUF262 domain-containing protein [Promicromonospora alba]|uniref:DUF262 domain-containing protein n=1 Tax=Promicromonospora alba TaxID=1616110 RepID=A0ABV9HM06_9MICO
MTQTKTDVFRIDDLVKLVSSGRLRVPAFQRNYLWDSNDVLALFDSILKGYPVGSVLLWKQPAEASVLRIGELVVDAPPVQDALMIVDGQQRITAIVNAVSAEVYESSDRFRIDFDLQDGRFVHGGRADDELRIPLPVLLDLRRLLEWTQGRPGAVEHIGAANDVAVQLRDFTVPASIVSGGDGSALLEIFDRINTSGKRLRRAEVFHALFSDVDNSGYSIASIADDLMATDFGRIDDETVLDAILARRHPDTSREFRTEFTSERRITLDVPADETREEAYRRGHEALGRAISFLQEHAGVPHVSFLPYRYLLITLARFFAHHPDPAPRNLELLVRWFWRAAISPTIFSGSATAMARGFASRVIPSDESKSVQQLLALLPDDSRFASPILDPFRTSTAAARVVLCALYAHQPRRFSDGTILGASALGASLGEAQSPIEVLAEAVPRRLVHDKKLAAGGAQRFFLTEDDVSLDRAREVIARELSDAAVDDLDVDAVASSHLVDDLMSSALREGRYDDFLRLRHSVVEQAVSGFLASRMGTGLPMNPPLTSLDLDDDDDDY